jgi:predicted small secreted protein
MKWFLGAYLTQRRRKMNVKRYVWGVLMIALLAMTGCNTMEGAGEDVQKAGKSIEKAAD